MVEKAPIGRKNIVEEDSDLEIVYVENETEDEKEELENSVMEDENTTTMD